MPNQCDTCCLVNACDQCRWSVAAATELQRDRKAQGISVQSRPEDAVKFGNGWDRYFERQEKANSREITPELVAEIERQLATTEDSAQEIADQLGVSAIVVNAIASDQNRSKETPKSRPAATNRRVGVPNIDRPVLSDGERLLVDPITCPVCEKRIYIVPCRICRANRRLAEGRRPFGRENCY